MKQWIFREKVPDDVAVELGEMPEMAKSILYHRGVKTRAEAEKFLNPKYGDNVDDPLLILNMEKAAGRIVEAIKNNERVIVFGDYDADGICSSVVFHDFFKKIGFDNFHVHIPDRYLEGYGLSLKAIDEFCKQGAKLIVSLDCGVTNVKEVEKANSLDLEVIIIDHHIVPENPPKAYAIVDLKQEGETYPTKFLSGAGIAFKTICAVIKIGKFNIIPGWEKWLLDVVAIATVADMVPLLGENRTLVYYGLKVLKKTQRPGLLSFYRQLKLSPGNIMEDDLSFMIAPRLNVAGRMDHATVSFNLLTTESSQEADWISERLETMNGDRREAVDKIIKTIDSEIGLASPTGGSSRPDLIMTGDISWSPGVLGLTANRVLEKYNCPVFLWGKGGDNIKGSCRSNGAINLVDFMKKLPDGLLDDIGGHSLSAGYSIAENKIEKLKEEIIKLYAVFPKKEIDSVIYIEKEAAIDDIGAVFFSTIEVFQPFGADNPKPIFSFKNINVHGVKKFGNGGIHLQLDFKKSSATSGSKIVSAIGFFMSKEGGLDLKAGQIIDLAASIEKSNFRNKPEIRLRIVDIKIK